MLLFLRRCFWEARVFTVQHPFLSLATMLGLSGSAIYLSEDRYRFLTAQSRAELQRMESLSWRERWFINFKDKQRLILPESVYRRLFDEDDKSE
ncbi:hypothetical protein BOX15_Mlig011011g1 [Macrostomum lignano]|uniref:Uncharacterized protein n=1 Tax=Macrostomum lignano TaxID=282301 RepID=A0A267EZ55_9PLAT|nr:hypothetical protein BOX15_Mlig011011g3 [Macrostomum lignano]PAA66781.1 hypothetical protein BOX15_Mlig011011g2 [Macrostomum lignano]PAA66789.1 hypothetical protein BOX15_Mlig011011g1 [Macrostomum lignano]